MFIFIVVVITLIAAVMCFLVLIQSGKGGGLAGIAAGGATTQILGARQAPDAPAPGTQTTARPASFTPAREELSQGRVTSMEPKQPSGRLRRTRASAATLRARKLAAGARGLRAAARATAV